MLLVAVSVFVGGCVAEEDDEFDEDPDFTAESEEELAPKADELRVVTHNIAGATTEGGPRSLDYVTSQAKKWKADAVMIQEACEDQVTEFKKRFPSWDVRFAEMRVDTKCGNKKKGNVLASRWQMSDAQKTDLGTAFERNFSMLCADIAKKGLRPHAVRACVTHLRAWDDAEAEPMRIAQTAAIHAELAPRVRKGQLVTIAGDFNTGVHREPMNNMYEQKLDGTFGGKGVFREADQTDKKFFGKDPKAPDVKCAKSSCRSGQDTHGGSKLDYVFFSSNIANGKLAGEVKDRGGSDHNLYRGAAKLSFE